MKIKSLFVGILTAVSIFSLVSRPVVAAVTWDKSSLEFNTDFGCKSTGCTTVTAEVCNGAESQPMTGTTTYQVYYSASGNPKTGVVVATGTVPALGTGQCTMLTYAPTAPGNYMFKVFQRPGHPGTGVLWSAQCQILACIPDPTPTPSPTPTPTPTPTPSPTPSLTESPAPSPSVSPSPETSPSPGVSPSPVVSPSPETSPTPSASPTPAPSSTPAPTSSPAPSSNPNPPASSPTPPNDNDGRHSSLSNDNLQCTVNYFDAVMDIKENGNGVPNVFVHFTYNGASMGANTNENGRAKVRFTQNGNGPLYATADGYPSQSMYINIPMCGNVQLETKKQGQVLGASTLAYTGGGSVSLSEVLLAIGTVLTGATAYGYLKAKKVA